MASSTRSISAKQVEETPAVEETVVSKPSAKKAKTESVVTETRTPIAYKVRSAGSSWLVVKPKYYDPELHTDAVPIYEQ